MEVTRVLVCEDEPLIARRLVRFIEDLDVFPMEIAQVNSQIQAFEFLAKKRIDLLFLDLNLHGRDGFDILRKLTADSFQTIVVSAHTNRAMEAFEIGILDFIGKPFSQERIRKALERYARKAHSKDDHSKYLVVQTSKGIDFIDTDQISYIKASGIYSELFLVDGSVRIYSKPLNQLLEQLPPDFIRIHKSYVTRTDDIVSIEKRQSNTYDVKLRSGEKIPLSRNARKELIRKFTS